MNAEQLYEEIKRAMYFFDLKFHDMDKVKITLDGRMLTFTYGERTSSIGLPQAK